MFSEELTALFPKAAVSEEVCKQLHIIESKKEIAVAEQRIKHLDEVIKALKKINGTMSGAIESLHLEE